MILGVFSMVSWWTPDSMFMVQGGKDSTPQAGAYDWLANYFCTTKQPLDTGMAVVLNESDGGRRQRP